MQARLLRGADMMKQRFLVQRLDTEMYFCHPSEVGEFKQWTKSQRKPTSVMGRHF